MRAYLNFLSNANIKLSICHTPCKLHAANLKKQAHGHTHAYLLQCWTRATFKDVLDSLFALLSTAQIQCSSFYTSRTLPLPLHGRDYY